MDKCVGKDQAFHLDQSCFYSTLCICVCVCVCVCRFYQIVPILIFNLEELIQPLKANRHRP